MSRTRHGRSRRFMQIGQTCRAALGAYLLTSAPVPAQTRVSPLPSDTDIRNLLVTRIDQHGGTGAVIVVVTPTGRRVVAYGAVSHDNERRVSGDTVFKVASITKVFTALLLADMVRRGEARLDEPAAQALKQQAAAIPARNGRLMTLADLATHTAGLPLRPSNLTSKDPDNKYDGYTPDLLYAFLSTYKLSRDPGSAYEYSNVGYGLLGQILSAKSGLSYEELLHRRIAGPLAMKSTALGATTSMTSRAATGYTADGRVVEDAERGALDAGGALHSTADDLATLLEVALGYRLSPLAPALASMVDTRRPGEQGPWAGQIALAWNITRRGDREIIWKNGNAGGSRSFIGYDRTARLGIIGLINVQSDLGVDDIGMHLLGADGPLDINAAPRRRNLR